ncbi:MAG: nicotinate mononucleotide-dependent phosphoribosyltransferase CobT [Nitrososphaera sp.]|jgi:uncharacterized protein (TIGR00303 family)
MSEAAEHSLQTVERPVFVCTISYTATSEIPGITVAGSNPDLVKYTPAADAEYLCYGKCRCIPGVPATPDGKPTPAVITRAALHIADIPFFIVDAGSKIKPDVPYISLGLEPGKNIAEGDAMSRAQAQDAFDKGRVLGEQLAGCGDMLVLGESIPGGTTTALAVLSGLGIDARFRMSSSMPSNPHEIKNAILERAIARRVNHEGLGSPLDIVAAFGDPMIASVAGIATGALTASDSVLLAGGTQMAAVLGVLKRSIVPLSRLYVGTTVYVADDPKADLAGLVDSAGPAPVLSCDLHLPESGKAGLRAYGDGFVKEGAGAGGASIAAMLKKKSLSGHDIRRAAETEYEDHIEAAL